MNCRFLLKNQYRTFVQKLQKMASPLSILRLILHVAAVVTLILSIAFALSAILTTGWQTYYDSGTQEIHQHGLWFDYTYTKHHVSGKTEPDWSWKYKFGSAVDGDEQHRWQPYQYNTLILLCVAAFLGFISVVVSYMAPYFITMAVVWLFVSIWPAFLSLAGVVLFFTTAALPNHNHIFTDRRLDLDINYSFYFAVVATVGFAVALALAIGAAIVNVILLRRGERPSIRETYMKVSSRSTTTTKTTSASAVPEKEQLAPKHQSTVV